jgi:hypothetical protein
MGGLRKGLQVILIVVQQSLRTFLSQGGHLVLRFATVVPLEQTFQLLDCLGGASFVTFNDGGYARDVVLPAPDWKLGFSRPIGLTLARATFFTRGGR